MPGIWTTRGFEAFRQGSFGDAGKNLYVSRGPACSSVSTALTSTATATWACRSAIARSTGRSRLPTSREPLTVALPLELSTEGARCGIVADLNGDGYDDLVLGMVLQRRPEGPQRLHLLRFAGRADRALGDSFCPHPCALRSRPAISTAMGGSTWRSGVRVSAHLLPNCPGLRAQAIR